MEDPRNYFILFQLFNPTISGAVLQRKHDLQPLGNHQHLDYNTKSKCSIYLNSSQYNFIECIEKSDASFFITHEFV